MAERLTARRLAVRLGSRSAQPPFDWDNRATWAPALRGVRAAYITCAPDLAVPGASEAIRAFAGLAVESGVRKLVLLSGRGEEEAQLSEQVLQAVAPESTIVRSSWFSQNFSENFLLDAVPSGEVALPVGDVPEPFIDVEDIADVAVAALTEDGHSGRIYEVTGPRLLTFAEAIAAIAEASGRAIRFVRIAPEEYVSLMRQHGVPDDYISLVMYLFMTVLDGRNARLADGVQRALGREPRDFQDYVRRTAATGA